MSWRTQPRLTSAPSLILVGALFALAVFSGCTRGLWEIGSLEARYPPVQATKGHRLGDATPYLFPANGAVQFFLCRWPDREPIPLSLRAGAEPELQVAVERAARAWEAALGIRFERREAPSGRGIEIRFADPRARNAAVSGHAIADCEIDTRDEANLRSTDSVPAHLTGASIQLRRVQWDQLGREIPLTPEELAGTALHELGHALGYSGHAHSGRTIMVRSTDDVRRAGRRLLAGESFADSTLRALYSVPSGTIIGRTHLTAAATRDIDALRSLASKLALSGPFVNVGDDLARIAWKRADGRDYPFLIFDPRGVARHPEQLSVMPVPRTRALLRENR